MAKKNETYALILSYPLNDYVVGLFDTAKEALEFAVAHPPRNWGDLNEDEELDERVGSTPRGFLDAGLPENGRVYGYVIQQFIDGKPTGHQLLEDYRVHEPLFTRKVERAPVVDPDQELDF